MNRLSEYLAEIREMQGLKNAILCGIVVEKRTDSAEFFLVTDRTYSAMEEENAREISTSYLPKGMTARVRIVKRVPDAQTVKNRIFEFVQKSFPAASAFLNEDSIEVQMLSSGAHFFVDVASGEQSLFESGKILDEVSKYLSSVFCGAFYGNVRLVEKKERDFSLLDETPEDEEEEIPMEIRQFPICEYEKIDGVDAPLKNAVYIADHANADGTYSICGRINYIEEIKYVKHNEKTNEDVEKTRFSITLTDNSANLRTTYFPKKASVDKIRELKVGDFIVITGSNEEYRGSTSFKASKINLGRPPEGFVPTPKKSKPVPKAYHVVFPEPYVDYTQAGLFDDASKPACLKGRSIVCFDLETTGLNNNPAMGKMDRIIEIGAVKLVDGEITEKFCSFVRCPERLSKEIVELTGIHDEDLVGQPEIEKVIADFYKFVDGSELLGHNVGFDYRFVQYYGEQNGYSFERKQYDTLTLAQDVLRGRLANYKLNTVAEHYGFDFNHHRAYEDAATTAKIFIELVRAKGSLE